MNEIRDGCLLRGTNSHNNKILERQEIAIGDTFIGSLSL